MFCPNCGFAVDKNIQYCSNCGKAFKTDNISLIGFSDKINDPAFQKYKKDSNSWSAIFASILAAIAIIAFPIYGMATGELEWPESLYYGIGIGSMFILIALIQILKRSLEKTWDGVIIFKDTYKQRDFRSRFKQYDTVYVMKIKKDNGHTKKHKWRNIPGPYHYYRVNDRVRHHKGFYYYEKYDKSHDIQIICAACNFFNEIELDACKRCKCPLLK